jgi:hypothetical protein
MEDLDLDRSKTLSVHLSRGHEGHCQGCGTNTGVYVITARSWQTRFCWDCLKYVFERAKKL